MQKHFHGKAHSHSFFEGWYLKHQSSQHTLILIPAWHVDACGHSYGSLQIILDHNAHILRFSAEECCMAEDRFYVQMGQNIFSAKGCRLHLDLPLSETSSLGNTRQPSPSLSIRGHLHYGPLHPPLRSFMGPFRFLPLPCRHDVLSLCHGLRGHVQIGDERWDFREGVGYIEKDWGCAFPKHYLWIQGNGAENTSPVSFLLTIADLSTPHHRFLACSSLLRHDGKHYRLSTYQGAHLNRYGSRRIDLRQGPYRLQIILPPEPTAAVSLLAPKDGTMNRIIEEHPRCPIRCQLYRGKELIFDQESPWGSYELA